MAYPKLPYCTGTARTVLQCEREQPVKAAAMPPLPGAVIVIHGVNDTGVAFDSVERGLCAGLNKRVAHVRAYLNPATYRLPTAADLDRLEPDPDAVFFKRKIGDDTRSPVIPFYWGYRETTRAAEKATAEAKHGQCVDQYGNRLDKDMSKGGGPFANATTTLPDMWNRGAPAFFDLVDKLKSDALRPVLKGPGRMYMVLAAKRLAALVSMIHDYEQSDVVSIVAHSQGCLVSLLAQAFLLQQGDRPADTLVLTHPPYSLEEPVIEALMTPITRVPIGMVGGGGDAAMEPHYGAIRSEQTLKARLDTLINIVNGVRERRATTPWLAADPKAKETGLVGSRWEPGRDRDNRGKVYLYFCPGDMTVNLRPIQGIGWQGVPDEIGGRQVVRRRSGAAVVSGVFARQLPVEWIRRRPIDELGASFLQRVFSTSIRLVQNGGRASMGLPRVGETPPYRYPCREMVMPGVIEDDHAHARKDQGGIMATHLDEGAHRTITGEALQPPFEPQIDYGSESTHGQTEGVDPVDAAIAVTSRYGLQRAYRLVDDPDGKTVGLGAPRSSPARELFPGPVWSVVSGVRAELERRLNLDPAGNEKPKAESVQVLGVHLCDPTYPHAGAGKLLIECTETPAAARLRHQHATSGRSFHGAIFGGPRNHEFATAYDVSIGGGAAVSHPLFYQYLCAVADWRLKRPKDSRDGIRPGILDWSKFVKNFSAYWSTERSDRKQLIEGNCLYYSSGDLPELPLLIAGQLPPSVVCESTAGSFVSNESGK